MGTGDELANAAWNGDLAKVEKLIATGAPVDGGFSNGHHSALNGAARNGHVAIVKFLLDREPRPDIESRCQEPWSVTPLQQAAYHGRADCARVLLRHGASTSATSGPGCGGKDAKGIALQMKNGQWRELVDAIDGQQQEEENSAEEEGAYPALIEITRRLEADLGGRVSGTPTEVIDAACKELNISTEGINIVERAHRAHDQLTARRRKPPPTTSR